MVEGEGKKGLVREKEKGKIFLFGSYVEAQNFGLTAKQHEPPPPALAYLDAVLKKEGYNVVTRDYAFWNERDYLDEVRNVIEEFKPDIVGISVMTMTRVSTYKAIKLIKQLNSKIKIILGGIHASMMYKQLIENFPIDAVCVGEGEITIIELVDALLKNKPLNKIKGIAYKNKRDNVIVTPQRELIHNLDEIPFPDYKAHVKPHVKQIDMVSSRGCPNKCSFCCLHAVSKQRWRPRGYMDVVNEIEYIIKNLPWIEKISFMDDTMILDNQRIINMCKEIVKRGIKISLQCSARIKPVSRELFYWMEKAGFDEIRFGIETGSPRLMEAIHKNITQEDCIRCFKILSEFKKINVVKFLIVGFPGETDETVNETIEFVKRLQKIIKMDFFAVNPLWVYPMTEVYEVAKKAGFIDDDYWLTDKPCPFFIVEHSEKKLKEMANRIAIETSMAQGKIYFLKLMLKRIKWRPKYYLRRITQLSGKDLNRILRNYIFKG